MPHGPNETGHKILEALDAGPLPYSELRQIVGAKSKHFGAVLHAMKAADMVDQTGNMVEMLERGAEALDELRAGREFEPVRTTVRRFPYERRAA